MSATAEKTAGYDFRDFAGEKPPASAPVAPGPVVADLVASAPATRPEPKAIQPHAWVGRTVLYWREGTPGEIAALPAILIAPTRGTDGWSLNFWRQNLMQGRANVKLSDKPKAGCFTWIPNETIPLKKSK